MHSSFKYNLRLHPKTHAKHYDMKMNVSLCPVAEMLFLEQDFQSLFYL